MSQGATNPRAKLSKRPSPDNFDPGLSHLHDDLVEVEALAITADEAVTMLPRSPAGRYRRTLARLYSLVGKTSKACAALERGEELVALHGPTWPRRASSGTR